jgi:hypothetical protein
MDDDDAQMTTDQVAGENSLGAAAANNSSSTLNLDNTYVKTSSMAKFYYRKHQSGDNLVAQSKSHEQLGKGVSIGKHGRQRSKSEKDFTNSQFE